MRVTIEGTVTPSVHLGKGERRTVERTEFVDKLIARGYVSVITEHPEPVIEEDPVEPGEAPVTVSPARNASRSVWADFLTDAGVPYPGDATRDELVAAWDNQLPADG